jgi:hypothetical protein
MSITVCSLTEIKRIEAEAMRSAARVRITESAGDIPSLLGTTADALQILLVQLATLAAAFVNAKDLAAIKAAAQPLADLTAPLLKQIATGETRMPYEAKGEAAVLADIATRATAVADALAPQGEAKI